MAIYVFNSVVNTKLPAIFQGTVLCVDEIEEENEKEGKGKEMQYDHVTYQMDFIIHACRVHGGFRRK